MAATRTAADPRQTHQGGCRDACCRRTAWRGSLARGAGWGWVQEAVPVEGGGELCLWCRMQVTCRQCGVRVGPHARAARRVGAALAAATTAARRRVRQARSGGLAAGRAAQSRRAAGHMHTCPAGTSAAAGMLHTPRYGSVARHLATGRSMLHAILHATALRSFSGAEIQQGSDSEVAPCQCFQPSHHGPIESAPCSGLLHPHFTGLAGITSMWGVRLDQCGCMHRECAENSVVSVQSNEGRGVTRRDKRVGRGGKKGHKKLGGTNKLRGDTQKK